MADIVPLTGENRILVKAGLERLPQTQKVGLRALMDIADVPGPREAVSHRVPPRPAPQRRGRLADATAALELLLTDNDARAGNWRSCSTTTTPNANASKNA